MLLATPALANEPPAKPADSSPKLAYGLMMKQGGKVLFSPCRDRSYVLVEDISNDGRVFKGLNMVGLDAGKRLYAELVGFVENGFLKASELNQARTEGRCQQPGEGDEAWRAGGNEPAWGVHQHAGRTVLKRPGKPDLSFPSAAFKRESDTVTHEFVRDNQRLQLRFDRGLCRDTMADTVFGWNAQVTLNGEALKGCAWQR
ncbi:MAG: hypothetical protein CFR70_03475 [Rhodocyclaceae bacterium]|nr:MAG: hypothetical protein CFR70_03475 [Rhodocyclaceae bacterium]